MTAPLALAAVFPGVSEADWHAAVSRSGAEPQHWPMVLSDDGLAIGPIYRRAIGAVPITRPVVGRRWTIVQRISADTAPAALAMCREEMAGGADGIALSFAGSLHPLGGQLEPDAAAAIAAGLEPILSEATSITIDAGPATPAAAAPFAELAARRHLELSLAFDPVVAAAMGRGAGAETMGIELSRLAETAARAGIRGTVARADGRIWNAGGASEEQELAAVLATVILYLRLLEERSLPLEDAAQHLGVALAADTNQFLTIAKVRAMRLLVQRALELAGVTYAIPIHAETAWRMMSRREPRMNVLRATGAAFAAAVGGADSITVLPFDGLDSTPSAQARRLARNTQLVIAEESQIAQFADPAAGSGAVESLTDALAEKAWARFQAIEATGGMLAAVSKGAFQREIAATRDQRLARLAEGKTEMIGVNAFVAKGSGALPPVPRSTAITGGLVFKRLAEDLESQS